MKPGLKKNISRWRSFSLLMVYVLIAGHIAHWVIARKTLAPLEFNEVLYSIHLGIITAGFIFMGLTIITTLIFGRFFCSWACHILALEDFSAWILSKFNIKPQPIRSRAFFIVPVVAMLYLFAWPQVIRIINGNAFPGFRILNDGDGWASFSTTDFWRNLPGVPVTLLTFFMVGFLIVYLMGSRSFCRYGCPYGVLFGWMDRLTPGKIVLTGNCNQCGLCTATCSSHVQVHKEIKEFGKVVDTSCLKDLDCVAVCPNDAIQYGFTKPSLGKSLRKVAGNEPKFSFTLAEDILLGIFVLAFTIIFRGLYDAVPFLLSITCAIILSYFTVLAWRTLRAEYVHMGSAVFRRGHKITAKGKLFLTVTVALGIFTVHSAVVHYHTWVGESLYNDIVVRGNTIQLAEQDADAKLKLDLSEKYLAFADKWGLFTPENLERELASIYIFRNDYANASVHLEAMLVNDPDDSEARLRLAKILILQGKSDQAMDALRVITQQEVVSNHDHKLRSDAHLQLGHLEEQSGFMTSALGHYEAALQEFPSNAEAALALGVTYTNAGRLQEGEKYLLKCDSLIPNNAMILNNLAVIYMRTNRIDIAILCLQRVVELQPQNISAHYNLGMQLLSKNDEANALVQFNEALELDPNHLNSHLALSMLYERTGDMELSALHKAKAEQLSPQ